MKTRILKFVLSAVLLMSTLCVHASTKIGELYYNLSTYDGASVTYKSEDSNNQYKFSAIEIPSEVSYNGISYTVTAIAYSAFSGCTNLTSIEIPNSVTSISGWAFEGCSSLGSIVIPNSVESIEWHTFRGCSNLNTIKIPNSVTSIGDNAFEGCSSLGSIVIPDSVTSIGVGAFYGCSSLGSIVIPNSVTSIGGGAFYGCSSLSSIVIPNSVTSIGEDAFYGCSSLGSIVIPNSVTSIGDRAFYGCSSLGSIVIPNSVTSIGGGAFYGCSSLGSIVIPDSVESIESNTFSGCSNLNTIEIPNSVTSIGRRAFYDCSSLGSIVIPNSVTSIGDSSFNGCGSLSSIVIPNSVTSIGKFAFSSCTSLQQVHIPGSLKTIDGYTFSSCNHLKNIIIENGVEKINSGAFSKIDSVCIVLPPSIKTIEEGNFRYSNLIIFNGDVSITQTHGTNFYILDSAVPTFINNALFNTLYFYSKDVLSSKNPQIDTSQLKQFNDGLSQISFDYTGLTQDPAKYTLANDVEKVLNSAGISYSFQGSKYKDCGEWKGKMTVEFRYNDWTATCPIDYDFKIIPIPLTLTLSNYSKIYGENNPNFEIKAEGFVGEDNIENALNDVSITTLADESSNVGEYAINITGGESQNYIPTFHNGKLIINKAPLILSVNDTTRVYGQPNPEFDISFEGFKLGESAESVFSEFPNAITEATSKSDAGIYSINATGGIAENYEITEYMPGTLTVTKAPLTLTANNAERNYYTENPEFDFTLTGLVNGDDKSCITKTPEYACDASLTSDCGEYNITPSNAQAQNYEINYENGKLSINKAPLSISVTDVKRKYGDANPRFEFIYSGLKEGEDASAALSKLPVATCSARANSPVGYYDIELSGAESANYEITYTPGILTVEKAPLTIRPKNVSRVYGLPNPSFELSYMGFKNDEDENVLFHAPQIATTATTESPVGEYDITVSGASAQNYEIGYEQGTLTITKNILKVVVNDESKFYGNENPKFSVRYEGLLNDDSESIITSQPQFTTEADANSNVGVYYVSAFGASSPNYNFEYQSGKLTVKPRQISAKVSNYSRPYGTSNPDFTVEYVGLLNGDDRTAITEPSTVICDANEKSTVGTYPITINGGRGQNYEVTSFTNGVLTVEKANQAIEWNQDLSSVNQYDQIELVATATSGLPVSYEVAGNNVVALYTSGLKTFIDCYGTGTVTIRASQPGNENYYPSETVTNRVVVVGEGGSVDPGSQDISINVSSPGTLSSKIAASKKYQIKSLIVSGTLNGSDIRYIREMAGRDVNGSKTNGILEKLDISRATIVSGGDYYYATNSPNSSSSYREYTSNNQISDYMFYECSTLTNLSLPQNCTKIGVHAFDGCLNLSNINMPDGIVSIGDYAFNGDISLTRISIPGHATSVGNYAFQNCTGLVTLILSSSVKTIGNGILNGCANIQEISLSSSNEYYSTLNGVLYNSTCTSLIIYPAGKQLQTFEIPDGVTEIKNSGFYGTKALKYLFLPESLTTIGADAFKGCSNLSKLFSRPSIPAVCANDCFDAVSKSNCTLYVPRGAYNSYWAAPVWADFLNIIQSNDLTVGGNIDKPDYCFEFPETTLSRGKCTYLPVSMNNVDPVVAFNCDIVLPEGVRLYEDASGQIVFKTSDRFPLSQMIDSRVQANGDVRIICTSSSNEAFNGTDGILFYIPLFITDPDASQDSEYQMTVKNIEFTRKDQSGYHAVESPDIAITLTVSEYSLGDANGDGRITGIDAVIAKGYFLGDNPANFIFKAADMNLDGKISSTDVVLITDEFLSQNRRLMAKATAMPDSKDYLRLIGTAETSAAISFDINLPNANRFTAIQMDITVPEGLSIKGIKVGKDNCATHDVRFFRHNDGMTRLFIYSENNDNFFSENLLTIELEGTGYVQGSDEIIVDEVLAVEISGHDYLEVWVDGNVSTISDISDISDITADSQMEIWSENSMLYVKSASDSVINLYDVAGHHRLVEIQSGITAIPLTQGVYLINDKKIIIK